MPFGGDALTLVVTTLVTRHVDVVRVGGDATMRRAAVASRASDSHELWNINLGCSGIRWCW